jgi:hypothetical protein
VQIGWDTKGNRCRRLLMRPCGLARRTSSPIVGPERARVPAPLTISAPSQPIYSVRYAPNTERVQPSFSRSATPKPCSFISMRSHESHRRRARDPHSRSGRLARRKRPQDSQQSITAAVAAARTRAQSPREHLAVHAAELAVEPNLQILRRHRRSLLLRLEHADRSALENHVHRTPRIGGGTLRV